MVLAHRGADTPTMNGVVPNTSSQKIAEIKRLVALGQYRVDPYEVADAMMRWAERELDAVSRRGLRPRAQRRCSYPARSPSTSVKVTPAGPSSTLPIQVSEALAVGQAA